MTTPENLSYFQWFGWWDWSWLYLSSAGAVCVSFLQIPSPAPATVRAQPAAQQHLPWHPRCAGDWAEWLLFHLTLPERISAEQGILQAGIPAPVSHLSPCAVPPSSGDSSSPSIPGCRDPGAARFGSIRGCWASTLLMEQKPSRTTRIKLLPRVPSCSAPSCSAILQVLDAGLWLREEGLGKESKHTHIHRHTLP